VKSTERPLELQEFVAPRVSRQSAHEGGKVVSPTHRPPLPPKPTAPPRTTTVAQLRQVKADSADSSIHASSQHQMGSTSSVGRFVNG
jgi:hypothetical protein